MGTDTHVLSSTANIEKSSVTTKPSESLPGNSDIAVRGNLLYDVLRLHGSAFAAAFTRVVNWGNV